MFDVNGRVQGHPVSIALTFSKNECVVEAYAVID